MIEFSGVSPEVKNLISTLVSSDKEISLWDDIKVFNNIYKPIENSEENYINMLNINSLVSYFEQHFTNKDFEDVVFPSIVSLADANIKQPVKLVLIGDSIYQDELKLKSAFAGSYGKTLFQILGQVFHKHFPNILTLNVVWCETAEGKTIPAKLLRMYGNDYIKPILMNRDLVADDAIIVAVGSVAWNTLFNIAIDGKKASSILSSHGYAEELSYTLKEDTRKFTVFPLISPAYVLKNNKLDFLLGDINNLFDIFYNVPGSLVDARNEFKNLKVAIQDSALIIDHVMDNEDFDTFLESIRKYVLDDSRHIVSFDVEARNTKPQDISNYLTLAGFGLSDSFCIQFVDEGLNNLAHIFKLLRDNNIIVVGQNIHYDFMMLFRQNILKSINDLPKYYDTMIMHHLIDENSPAGLKYMMQKYCGWSDYSAELDPYLKEVNNDYGKLPFKILQPYHALDLCGNLKLFFILENIIKSEDVSKYWKLDYYEFTHSMDKILLGASMQGMYIDREERDELSSILVEKTRSIVESFDTAYTRSIMATMQSMDKSLKDSILTTLGSYPIIEDIIDESKITKFNPGSGQHLTMLLAAALSNEIKQIIKLKLRNDLYTPTGKIKVAEDNLNAIRDILEDIPNNINGKEKVPYVKDLLGKVQEYKEAVKLNSTYLEGMLSHMWADDKVRARWKVTGTVTGRLSCTSPNLQQIPRGGSVKIKQMFTVSKSDYLMMNFDLSQAEMRGLASISGDEKLAKAYREGLDVHKYVGSMIFSKDYDSITKEERQASKPWGFGAIYGASASTLAVQAGINRELAKVYLGKFFTQFDKVLPWIKEQHEKVKSQGYVTGVLGRKRRLPASLSRDPENLSDLCREAQNYCLTPDTQILTPDGWKYYTELEVGTPIYSFNTKSNMLEEDKILKVNILDKESYGYTYKSNTISFGATLDHRWLVCLSDTGRTSCNEFINTEMLRSNYNYNLVVAPVEYNKAEIISISKPIISLFSWLMLYGSRSGEDLLITFHDYNSYNVISSCLKDLKNSRVKFDEERDDKHSYIFRIKDKVFINKVLDFMPDLILTHDKVCKLTTSQAKYFLNSLIKSQDFTKMYLNKNRLLKCLFLSEDVIDCIQHLIVIAGYSTSVNKLKLSCIKKYFINTPKYLRIKKSNDIYAVTVNVKRHTSVECSKLVYSSFPLMWCPTTTNSTWIARKDNTVYVTGNCVQNLASDFNLLVLKNIIDYLKESKLDVKLINTVHDSTMWEVYKDDVESFYDIYYKAVDDTNKYFLKIVGDTWVDMAADAECGLSWADMYSLNKKDEYLTISIGEDVCAFSEFVDLLFE